MGRVWRLCFLAALLTAPLTSWAASEADRRDCARHDDYERRVAACTKLIEDPTETQAMRLLGLRTRGYLYWSKGLGALAIPDLDEAIRLDPSEHATYRRRGLTYHNLGRYPQAIADFTEALRRAPRNTSYLNDRGLSHYRMGESELALADFDAAITIDPKMYFAIYNRGLVLARRGDYDGAIKNYEAALAVNPSYLLAIGARGKAYEQKNDFERAIADYKRVLDLPARPGISDDATAKTSARRQLERLEAALFSQQANLPERRVALVIANSAYTQVAPLRNPEHDGRALVAALRALQFSEVREVYNGTLADITKAVKEFGDLAQESDWAVIYFAGHGIEAGGVNYLLPVDAKLEKQAHIEDEALALSRVLSKVTAARKLQMVILDACRNNPFLTRMERSGRSTRSVARGLSAVEPEGGVLVAYAARDGTVAMDGDGNHSPFAEALVKHIQEPGLEISLLFRKVRDSVLAATNRQQEPFTYGSLPAQAYYFKRR